MTKIKYSCIALPPHGIRLEKIYLFGKDADGYFFEDAKVKKHLSIEEIKVLFTPVGKSWNEVLFEKKESKKEK